MNENVAFDGAAPSLHTLVPYAPEECISVGEAAKRARKSARTIRNWCIQHAIGRHIADGGWAVSQVALLMLLDGNRDALVAYRDKGIRGKWDVIAEYYRRCGLSDLLQRPEFAAR